MSPKKRYLVGIASVAFCALCAFGLHEYRQIKEVEKRIAFFEEFSKLDFSVPKAPAKTEK